MLEPVVTFVEQFEWHCWSVPVWVRALWAKYGWEVAYTAGVGEILTEQLQAVAAAYRETSNLVYQLVYDRLGIAGAIRARSAQWDRGEVPSDAATARIQQLLAKAALLHDEELQQAKDVYDRVCATRLYRLLKERCN